MNDIKSKYKELAKEVCELYYTVYSLACTTDGDPLHQLRQAIPEITKFKQKLFIAERQNEIYRRALNKIKRDKGVEYNTTMIAENVLYKAKNIKN